MADANSSPLREPRDHTDWPAGGRVHGRQRGYVRIGSGTAAWFVAISAFTALPVFTAACTSTVDDEAPDGAVADASLLSDVSDGAVTAHAADTGNTADTRAEGASVATTDGPVTLAPPRHPGAFVPQAPMDDASIGPDSGGPLPPATNGDASADGTDPVSPPPPRLDVATDASAVSAVDSAGAVDGSIDVRADVSSDVSTDALADVSVDGLADASVDSPADVASHPSDGGTVGSSCTLNVAGCIVVTSATHPDPSRIYNDAFPSLDLTWSRPFSEAIGFYTLLNATLAQGASPANGRYTQPLTASYSTTRLLPGANFFHIVPVDSTFSVGTGDTAYRVQINKLAVAMASPSHPDSNVFSDNPNVYLQWSLPVLDTSYRGVYYRIDHFGDTVPTRADYFVPLAQRQVILPLNSGVWGIHMVSADSMGYLTQQGAHYRIMIGADPGSGGVNGTVVDSMSRPVSGAAVMVNRGLLRGTTTSSLGTYTFASLPAGVWELSIASVGRNATPRIVSVGASSTSTIDFLTSP